MIFPLMLVACWTALCAVEISLPYVAEWRIKRFANADCCRITPHEPFIRHAAIVKKLPTTGLWVVTCTRCLRGKQFRRSLFRR